MVEKIISIANTSDQDSHLSRLPCVNGGLDHHWDLEPPDSQISLGTCRNCGSKREFYNYGGDWDWYGDPFKEAGSLAPAGISQRGVDEDNIINE